MRFELIEPNKQFSNNDLTNDLSRVAGELWKGNITIREYTELWKFSYQTLTKRFGSWDKAIKGAWLEERKRQWWWNLSETKIPENLLISDMQKVSKKLNKKDITIADYDKNWIYWSSVITKRFKGWNNAKKIANLEIGRLYNSTDEDYFENIFSVWWVLGRQPKYQEMISPLSKLHISSYERKFGTWRNALEKFIEYINSKDDIKNISSEFWNWKTIEHQSNDIKRIQTNIKKSTITKRSNRIANLRQRFRVMKRDDFKCILCWDSPAKNPNCELHIDHIIPWSKWWETIEENLRTLCSNCNLWRSNKE